MDATKMLVREMRIEDHIKLIELQLRCADGYAKKHIGGDDILNIWMIQNSHLRDQIIELRNLLRSPT